MRAQNAFLVFGGSLQSSSVPLAGIFGGREEKEWAK